MKRIVTVTGPSDKITAAQVERLYELLSTADLVRHGLCTGADAAAHDVAKDMMIPICGHPGVDREGKEKKRAFLTCFTELREQKWFLDRNEDMVKESTEVVALVKKQSTSRYRAGEWNTIYHALRLGVPVTLVLPDGELAGIEVTS